MNEDSIPVKASVLRLIHTAMAPTMCRVESLVEDLYADELVLSHVEKAALLDILASSLSLDQLLKDYINDAEEHKSQFLILSKKEFQIVLQLAKVVETANHMVIGQTPLWVH